MLFAIAYTLLFNTKIESSIVYAHSSEEACIKFLESKGWQVENHGQTLIDLVAWALTNRILIDCVEIPYCGPKA